MVGKYVDLLDAYKSLNEGAQARRPAEPTPGEGRASTPRISSAKGTGLLEGMDAILVPGGFGDRGVEGKITAVRYARENRIPSSASAWACTWRWWSTPAMSVAWPAPTPPR